jgi:hypothetical protein
MECIFKQPISFRKLAVGKFKAKATYSFNAKTTAIVLSDVNTTTGFLAGTTAKVSGISHFKNKNIHVINLRGLKSQRNGSVKIDKALLIFTANLRTNIAGISQCKVTYAEKFGGSIDNIHKLVNYQCKEKLYPTKDINVQGFVGFNNKYVPNNLYESIDDGIISFTNSDNDTTYIQALSQTTEGFFSYAFKVAEPTIRPIDSLLVFKVTAPLRNNTSRVAPLYTIQNIQFKDPANNLIIRYKDFTIRGDDLVQNSYKNFGIYATEPLINNVSFDTSHENYPLLGSGITSGDYIVSFDVISECRDDPFDDGYDESYEEYVCNNNTPFTFLQTESSNDILLENDGLIYLDEVNDSLKIFSIEMCNSGESASYRNKFLSLFSQVPDIGERLTRNIFPKEVLLYNQINDIYPSVQSLWSNSTDNNLTVSGASQLVPSIVDNTNQSYIRLDYSSIQNSGKLLLKFSHEPPFTKYGLRDGAFDFGVFSEDKAFDTAKFGNITEPDIFFTIDKIDLKVIARKSPNTPNYFLDVVGYSNDRLLNVTSEAGGFLQNRGDDSITSFIPAISGFKSIDDLAIGNRSISEKDQYFEDVIINNDGGDHYILTNVPLIDSTSFKEYTIPLKIYEDKVEIGKSIDYSMSSFFEHLFLDIYPIPSGAEISKIWLSVSYKPSNALTLYTLGSAEVNIESRSNLTLLPSGDFKSTSGSLLNNLPHGYSEDTTLKTNYGKRWTVVSNAATVGPFDVNMFDFSFRNPQMYLPFLNGYFSFIHDQDNIIISDYSYDQERLDCVVSGTYVGTYNKVTNLGLRFIKDSLFEEPTLYKTIDWTSIAGYENNDLSGKITDNFNNAVRVSGALGYIDFGNINTASGFAIHTTFTPDINMISNDYNLWNSGVLFGKYDRDKDLEFAVYYSGGYLTGACKSIDNNIVVIQDQKLYSDYTYPMSVTLTYNEQDNKLRLFTKDVVDVSEPFEYKYSDNHLTFGYLDGLDIGVNVFLHDVGISTVFGPSGYPTNVGINIISQDINSAILTENSDFILAENDSIIHTELFGKPNKNLKQVKHNDIFNRDIYSAINDDASKWKLGSFNICQFNKSYDSFTERVGENFIVHYLKHSGSGYVFDFGSSTLLTESNDLLNTENDLPISTEQSFLPDSVYDINTCYHTQIENDFIRLHIEDSNKLDPSLYSVAPRISKTLPRGYHFEKEAIAVDTILQYETKNDIVWPDNNIGPKLIVSLYTPNKEPKFKDADNYGLINRHIHYLKPSGCWKKVTSVFDFDQLFNDSEKWLMFNEEQILTEFNHKYFSKDIDDMFLQYDLVYPSGSPFESTLKIHSANVRLDRAFMKMENTNENFTLYVSGEKRPVENINLYTLAHETFTSDIPLYTEGFTYPNVNNALTLYCSGANVAPNQIPLYIANINSVSNFVGNNMLYGSIGVDDEIRGFNLYCDGKFITEDVLPMYLENKALDQSAISTMPLFVLNQLLSDTQDQNILLYIRGFDNTDTKPESAINLYTSVSNISQHNVDINLYLQVDDAIASNENMPLYVFNSPSFVQLEGKYTLFWYNKDVGRNIDTSDNIYASVDANDEIRGVELICYGECK